MMSKLMNEVLTKFTATYGPFAFGLATVLILWTAMLQPLLNKQTLDTEVQRKIIEAQNATLDAHRSMIRDQERLSDGLRQTAVILERIIKEMDSAPHTAIP